MTNPGIGIETRASRAPRVARDLVNGKFIALEEHVAIDAVFFD